MVNIKVVIIKYNAGNVFSVDQALKRLGISAEITDDPEKIMSADKVIFPGVGEAGSTMKYLKDTGLADLIGTLKQDLLGICLGMQLMGSHSEEGNANCLDIIPMETKRFSGALKIPHMGWNQITGLNSPLFDGIEDGVNVYFVHSYYVMPDKYCIASCNYGEIFCAGAQKDNYYALQFHPEKSGQVGQKILKNFIEL